MFCKKCGKELNEGAAFCPNCGEQVNGGTANANTVPVNPQNGGNEPLTHNIAVSIVLSIVTCGIYAIYWFIMLTDEVNRRAGTPEDTSGGIAFLLSMVTCGIYAIYWAYRIGEKVDAISGQQKSSNILYLVLELFGLQIIVLALAQDAVNKAQ